MKFLQLFFCGSSSGTFSCSNWVKILTWGSDCWKSKQLLAVSSTPKRICYSFVCKHNISLNHTLLSNHTWKMTTLPSSAWRYNVHEEVMKLWAWFITSSQRPLTKVRGYSRCILGIMASNCKKNKNTKHWEWNQDLHRRMSACNHFKPAHVVALQMEAGSDSLGCTQTAHHSESRLHDRLWK